MAGTSGSGRTGGCGRGCGVITRRGAGGAGTGLEAAGAATGVGAAALGAGAGGGGAGRAGGGAGRSAASRWARSMAAMSPGLLALEKSILGFCSTSRAAAFSLPCPAKNLRTRSASSASMELECVFFSVTPTLGRVSRTILLGISSSRAKSLMRILLTPAISPAAVWAAPQWMPAWLFYAFIDASRSDFNQRRYLTGSSSSRTASPCTCTSETSASGAFWTPTMRSASSACPVSSASWYSETSGVT